MDNVHILWTRTIFHGKFFQKTVHNTWPIYNWISFIHMELSSFGTLLKFSLKLCVEFQGYSLMHIWQSLNDEKTFLFLYFISIVHEMWTITIFRGQFFRKIFHLIFHGHCPYNMDNVNITWTMSVDNRRPWTIVHETYKTPIITLIYFTFSDCDFEESFEKIGVLCSSW